MRMNPRVAVGGNIGPALADEQNTRLWIEGHEKGSLDLLRALRGRTEGSDELIWKDRRNTATWPSGALEREIARTGDRLAARREMDERAERQWGVRDPCPYCETRRDIGCKHYRRAA